MKIEWLGQVDCVSSIQKQDKIIDRVSLISLLSRSETSPSETILGLEHPLTITMGKRSDILKDIRVSVKELRAKKVEIVGVERGGQATLHNPGQLVIYPVINLRERGIRVRDYVHLLEDVTKRFLQDFGIKACCRGDEPGLYTINGKIAFFGVRIKRGITSHGLAINVRNDLNDFQMIRSCGKATETFAKMEDFSSVPELEDLFKAWCNYFQTGLGLTEDVNRPMLKEQVGLRV